MPRPSSHRASSGTRTFRRAESSMTMELDQIRPSTVSGMRRAVQPSSPCACTKAYACSYDTTAATTATPTTAAAVDHLMTLSPVVIAYRPRPA